MDEVLDGEVEPVSRKIFNETSLFDSNTLNPLEEDLDRSGAKVLAYLARIAFLQEAEEALKPDPYWTFLDKGKCIKIQDLSEERILEFILCHLRNEGRKLVKPVQLHSGPTQEILTKFYRQVEFAFALDSPTFCEFWLEAKRRNMIETLDIWSAPTSDRLRGLDVAKSPDPSSVSVYSF